MAANGIRGAFNLLIDAIKDLIQAFDEERIPAALKYAEERLAAVQSAQYARYNESVDATVEVWEIVNTNPSDTFKLVRLNQLLVQLETVPH